MSRRSLSVQMLVALVFWATLILSMYAAGDVWFYRTRSMERLNASLDMEAEQLRAAIALALWHYDTDQIDKVLDGVMKNNAIIGLKIVSEDRTFVRKRDRDWHTVNAAIELAAEDSKTIHKSLPVVYMDENLGLISLWATTRFLDQDVYGAIVYFAAGILMLDLVLVISLYLMLSRVVITPLRKLEAYAVAVSQGEEQVSEAPHPFGGEMEVLRGAMARMLEELKSRYLAIQNEARRFRDSEERFRILLNTIPDMVWLKDPDGVFLACNRMFCILFGAEENEILGRTDYDFVAKDLADSFRENDRRVMVSRETRGSEETVPLKDGSCRILETIKAPMYDAEGNLIGVLGVGRDITARVRAEQERARLKEQLNQSQKLESIGRLAGGVAHDFNNMLGVIQGNADLALAENHVPDRIREYLQDISRAAVRSAALTRQLLAFARREEVSPCQMDMNDTMAGMLKILKRVIGEDVELKWRPGEGIWPVKMDPSQLDHILVNLCINAKDAVDQNGQITIETRNITVDRDFCENHPDARSGDFVLLGVSDNGRGMPKEILAQIFEPFFTTKETGKGTGLGLSTVYGVVRQNSGFVTVYSEPGMGTVFHVYLPRYEGTAEASPEQERQERAATGHETLLVVEDEASILLLISRTLEKYGYTVLSAGSPAEAIEISTRYKDRIHLLLTDVIMPQMNGKELATAVRTQRPDIRVLFMSGYTADVIVRADIESAEASFIQKPFSNRDLLKRIRELLDACSAPDSEKEPALPWGKGRAGL